MPSTVSCSTTSVDTIRQSNERNDEFAYFGEEIADYRKLLLQYAGPEQQVAVDVAHRRVVLTHDVRAAHKSSTASPRSTVSGEPA